MRESSTDPLNLSYIEKLNEEGKRVEREGGKYHFVVPDEARSVMADEEAFMVDENEESWAAAMFLDSGKSRD